MRQLDRLDRELGLGAHPASARPPRRTTSPTLVGLVITGLLLGGVVLLSPDDRMRTVRRLIGMGDERFAEPPDFDPGEGVFTFSQTQPGSDDPVGFDPCRAIEYVVNPADGPSDWRELVETGVEHTEWATGLRFRYLGTTEQVPFDDATRAGARPPVVIGFATADEVPGLAGSVAGLGGSTAITGPSGRRYLVTGSIALDSDSFDDRWWGTDSGVRQAIVDHEFGHLVGLGHAPSNTELMHAEGADQTTYGPGDLEGLARLGSVPCG